MGLLMEGLGSEAALWLAAGGRGRDDLMGKECAPVGRVFPSQASADDVIFERSCTIMWAAAKSRMNSQWIIDATNTDAQF